MQNAVKEAINTAKRAHHPLFRHGAVIVAGNGKVIARAFNVKGFYGHAERRLLNKLSKMPSDFQDRRNLTLIVVRINWKDELMYSKPCTGCAELIRIAGIPYVLYSS